MSKINQVLSHLFVIQNFINPFKKKKVVLIGLNIHSTKPPAIALSISSFIALALTQASTGIFRVSSNDLSFSNY
jgi:hypothetical protein